MFKKILLSSLVQNAFPFFFFWYSNSNFYSNMKNIDNKKLQNFKPLPEEKCIKELANEHARAESIDNKTSKFTLSLSISLTILSSTASGLSTLLPSEHGVYVTLALLLSSFYMLMGGVLSLGALKTLPIYGYGAHFQLDRSLDKYAEALMKMEEVNIIRHQRNETAFMCLRNGFIITGGTLLVIIVCVLTSIIS